MDPTIEAEADVLREQGIPSVGPALGRALDPVDSPALGGSSVIPSATPTGVKGVVNQTPDPGIQEDLDDLGHSVLDRSCPLFHKDADKFLANKCAGLGNAPYGERYPHFDDNVPHMMGGHWIDVPPISTARPQWTPTPLPIPYDGAAVHRFLRFQAFDFSDHCTLHLFDVETRDPIRVNMDSEFRLMEITFPASNEHLRMWFDMYLTIDGCLFRRSVPGQHKGFLYEDGVKPDTALRFGPSEPSNVFAADRLTSNYPTEEQVQKYIRHQAIKYHAIEDEASSTYFSDEYVLTAEISGEINLGYGGSAQGERATERARE